MHISYLAHFWISGNRSPRGVLIEHLQEHANRSGYSYDEIGILCGFKTGIPIYAFTRGEIRPPLDKIVTLAEVLSCDCGQLFTLALKEWFSPELFEQMREAFLVYPGLQQAKADWLKTFREIFDGKVPEDARSPARAAQAGDEIVLAHFPNNLHQGARSLYLSNCCASNFVRVGIY